MYEDKAWTLNDIIKKLCEAADILLNKKNYDDLGYEEIKHCLFLAEQHLMEKKTDKDKLREEIMKLDAPIINNSPCVFLTDVITLVNNLDDSLPIEARDMQKIVGVIDKELLKLQNVQYINKNTYDSLVNFAEQIKKNIEANNLSAQHLSNQTVLPSEFVDGVNKQANLDQEQNLIDEFKLVLPEIKSTTLNGCLNTFEKCAVENNDLNFVKGLFCRIMNHYKYNCK